MRVRRRPVRNATLDKLAAGRMPKRRRLIMTAAEFTAEDRQDITDLGIHIIADAFAGKGWQPLWVGRNELGAMIPPSGCVALMLFKNGRFICVAVDGDWNEGRAKLSLKIQNGFLAGCEMLADEKFDADDAEFERRLSAAVVNAIDNIPE